MLLEVMKLRHGQFAHHYNICHATYYREMNLKHVIWSHNKNNNYLMFHASSQPRYQYLKGGVEGNFQSEQFVGGVTTILVLSTMGMPDLQNWANTSNDHFFNLSKYGKHIGLGSEDIIPFGESMTIDFSLESMANVSNGRWMSNNTKI